MNVIINNPYRIVGLLVGATAAEQRRQLTRLQRFLQADQEPDVDFSFPTLGKIHRTLEMVEAASSKLDLDSDKINAALFWFYKGNPITDEPAFDAFKESDLDQVLNIWTRLTSNGELTQRNASAFNNLGTLYLSGILEGTNTNEALLEQGISLKLKFLESVFMKELATLATDDTFKITKKELQILFLNQLKLEIENSKSVTLKKFIDIIFKQDFLAKDDFFKGYIQKPIEQIEKYLEDARNVRKVNKATAINAGKTLYDRSSEFLRQFKSILGTSNLTLSSISDKVSDEILQCGIDYFLHYKDSSTDPGSASMDLFRKAKTLAIGNIAKQRCQENTENLQEWIDEKPERDKQARINTDFEKLKNLIDEYEGKSETVANAKQLLVSARTYLNNIKNILGSTDELYLGLSSRIASDAQSMCVSQVNNLQERLENSNDNSTQLTVIMLLNNCVNEAWVVSNTIGAMDLTQEFRTRFTKNKNSLSNLKSQLSGLNTSSGGNSRISSSSSSSSGCYIATMAYGDYDHPQVLILRKYRDEVLDKSSFGKWFIKTYYFYSPKLVEKLKNKKAINNMIRKFLNQFIKYIK